MPITEAQKRATMKYQAKAYDKMTFRFPKGKKDIMESHITKQGESLNKFVNRAIDEAMERDNEKSG